MIHLGRPLLCQEYLLKVIEQVQTTVNDLFCSHDITQRQYDQIRINRSEVELNYLVFVLDTKKVGFYFHLFMIQLLYIINIDKR